MRVAVGSKSSSVHGNTKQDVSKKSRNNKKGTPQRKSPSERQQEGKRNFENQRDAIEEELIHLRQEVW